MHQVAIKCLDNRYYLTLGLFYNQWNVSYKFNHAKRDSEINYNSKEWKFYCIRWDLYSNKNSIYQICKYIFIGIDILCNILGHGIYLIINQIYPVYR